LDLVLWTLYLILHSIYNAIDRQMFGRFGIYLIHVVGYLHSV
jgi:hypothetical protein